MSNPPGGGLNNFSTNAEKSLHRQAIPDCLQGLRIGCDSQNSPRMERRQRKYSVKPALCVHYNCLKTVQIELQPAVLHHQQRTFASSLTQPVC